MKILIIGEQANFEECREKLGHDHTYSWVGDHREAEKFLDTHSLIFDFIIDEEPHEFEIYANKSVTVFLNTCKISLGELAHSVNHKMLCTVFGFNGLPTLFNRPVLELALWQQKDQQQLQKICSSLGTEFMLVDDRVGLVTPRVIGMIINEAYYTVQEGTASRDDIDMAMKSGTNYPYGPFEWSRRIGIRHVYELLEAVYEDTKDERYKICALLKREYLSTGG
ncbi:3-hydroxyacyl-CoA dehydrogenase [Fulvivirgaceae bacterium PWU4]|uniref:3-hydroxyacyl-CoA dehydrogenase n=1 Tax=Chryseosolibacter histidini TaxID=2782349 RepID=A0AAP2DTP4_9BACT|nr:3-hydroxyacyl-CoA dehydrogenase family protein [Chryseosolibacter histidini]MBT1700394.1 3-hydroxyacyl-CoA dehydrogenase [Chryseosolibacter histidini]